MSYAVGSHFKRFIQEQVEKGRYNNASEVVREGLRLVEEREAKFAALRNHIDHAIEVGGEHSDAEIEAFLESEATKPL